MKRSLFTVLALLLTLSLLVACSQAKTGDTSKTEENSKEKPAEANDTSEEESKISEELSSNVTVEESKTNGEESSVSLESSEISDVSAPAESLAPPSSLFDDTHVYYVRTDGYNDGFAYPKVITVRSTDELRAYYEENKDNYRLGYTYTSAISSLGFSDVCCRYNAGFFEENALVFVVLEEPSGSIRHKVIGISNDSTEAELSIRIESSCPEEYTDDMAQWHIIIELEKGKVPSANEIDVVVQREKYTASDEPEAYQSYQFESYADLEKALTETGIQVQGETTKGFEVFLHTFKSGEIKLVLPQINGSNATLRNKTGFSNITVFPSELYNLPWIWYHCAVDGEELKVCVAYYCLTDSLIDIKQYSSYEKEIVLADGTAVQAAFQEARDSSRLYVRFFSKIESKTVLVSVFADKALLTDEFWKTFSLKVE